MRLLLILLSGCTHVYDDHAWVRAGHVEWVQITKIENIDACEPGQLACAMPYGNQCTIHVPKNDPAIIGHEAAHCFGWVH